MANIFQKMKEYVTNADGSHSLISRWVDSSTVVTGIKKDGSDLTLKESEVTINYKEYKALEKAGELEPEIKYIVPDFPSEGTGGGVGNTTALEMTEADYALNKEEYDASDNIFFFDEDVSDEDAAILDSDIKLSEKLEGRDSSFLHGLLVEQDEEIKEINRKSVKVKSKTYRVQLNTKNLTDGYYGSVDITNDIPQGTILETIPFSRGTEGAPQLVCSVGISGNTVYASNTYGVQGTYCGITVTWLYK